MPEGKTRDCLFDPYDPWSCKDPAAPVTYQVQVKENIPEGIKLLFHVLGTFYAQPRSPGEAEGLYQNFDTPVQLSIAPAPEFPAPYLPITAIIGLLGAVLLIQRTREH